MNASRWILWGTLVAAGAACSEKAGPTAEIETTRRASEPSSPVKAGATTHERFGPDQMPHPDHEGHEDEETDAAAVAEFFDYDLPPGWTEIALEGERVVNVLPGGDPETSCYLTFLAGDGGGLAANVNRWRKQLGLEPLAETAVAALPTHPMFNRDATLVELEGTFTGMGEAPRTGFKLCGLIVCESGGSIFVKFTGPAARVDAERANFLAFASSLRLAAGHGNEPAADDGGSARQSANGANGLSWTAPAGWIEQPPRSMREVTFTVGAGGECYIARLGAGAGGLRMNLDRWRDQFGLEKLTDAELAALPSVTLLGKETPLLELEGGFKGMGDTAVPDQGLLGVALFRPQDSLFVKFTGPAAVVRAERASFLAFVASLTEDA